MFDFFNKKSSPRHNFSGFSNQFTKDQKAAIISSLLIVAKADGNVNNKEIEYVIKNIPSYFWNDLSKVQSLLDTLVEQNYRDIAEQIYLKVTQGN